jgi:type II secretory pathway component PulK
MRREDGFALLAVLWVVAAMSGLGLLVSLSAREAIGAADNRANLTRAAWRAADCVERARAAAGEALEDSGLGALGDADPWSELDRVILSHRLFLGSDCDLTITAAGTAIDVNTAGTPVLLRALQANGVFGPGADSLLAALLDWTDADDIVRAEGAERGEYLAAGQPPPRNGPIADIRELLRVRGWAAAPGRLAQSFGVDSLRVSLNHAPPEVIAALPGFTREAVARIMENRAMGQRIGSLEALGAQLSTAARDSLNAHYFELRQLTVTSPDFWIITAQAREGRPSVGVRLEVTIARAGRRAAIMRRRSEVL